MLHGSVRVYSVFMTSSMYTANRPKCGDKTAVKHKTVANAISLLSFDKTVVFLP